MTLDIIQVLGRFQLRMHSPRSETLPEWGTRCVQVCPIQGVSEITDHFVFFYRQEVEHSPIFPQEANTQSNAITHAFRHFCVLPCVAQERRFPVLIPYPSLTVCEGLRVISHSR